MFVTDVLRFYLKYKCTKIRIEIPYSLYITLYVFIRVKMLSLSNQEIRGLVQVHLF